MSNFIYYEHIEDYEEQVRKAKLCDEKDIEIKRLKNIITENTKKDIDYNKNIETRIQQLFSKDLTMNGRKRIINDFINMEKEIERLNNIIEEKDKRIHLALGYMENAYPEPDWHYVYKILDKGEDKK